MEVHVYNIASIYRMRSHFFLLKSVEGPFGDQRVGKPSYWSVRFFTSSTMCRRSRLRREKLILKKPFFMHKLYVSQRSIKNVMLGK